MGMIEQKAQLIASEMAKTNVKHQEPMLIITIIGIVIGIITDLVQTYESCQQTPQQAAISMRSGGILERFRLRRVIAQHINDSEMQAYIGQEMFATTLNVAQQLKDDEVVQMYEEVAAKKKK